jgi:glucose-6-phosphate 1-dehydrogenase
MTSLDSGAADARASPARSHAAGAWGPAASIALIERDGRAWNEETE